MVPEDWRLVLSGLMITFQFMILVPVKLCSTSCFGFCDMPFHPLVYSISFRCTLLFA